MEETSTRLYRMGKYTHVNCRQCKLTKTSNNHHVSLRRNSSERRYSYANNCAEIMRQECIPSTRQEARNASDYSTRSASDLYSSDAQESCINSAQESCINCANCSCESQAGERLHAAGKELGYRGKKGLKTRSRSVAGQKQNGQRFLTRSTSCGNVRYADYRANESCTSSGTDSECSDTFESSSNTAGTCLECRGDVKSLKSSKGMSSMPDLMRGLNNNNNTQDGASVLAGNNHLGLEVMLSLINGPMQSVIDSKDEKIRSQERIIERLECENKQIKSERQPGDATKIFTLEKTLENCVRQIEQLEEANKTAQEKVRLLEDLRKNDKECIDILRAQTNDLETKLTKSDERVREAEKDGKSQNQWLKQHYEKQIAELQGALRAKETKLRDMDKVKSRVAKQKLDLENQRNSENELHAKMCEQVLELKRDLQLHQTRLNILEREKRSLEENLSQSENLQRQDQKSSYVLQMKIVEMQEKLDLSYRKNEELDKQREISEAKRQVLEEKLKQAMIKSPAKWQLSVERVPKEGLSDLGEVDASYTTKINKANSPNMQQPTRLNETKPDNSDRGTTVLNRPMSLDMNDVLREKVAELQKKLYKGQQTMYEGERVSNEAHVQDLNYCEHEKSLQEKWGMKEQSCDNARPDSMDETVPVRDLPLKKMEPTFTGDKR
ncbi:Hypothetical predicted protein [Paramuricea clavata]|nr:Hypothetical predicted protein [Paramuricea clavata]